jgi:hypothetical protein
MSDENALLLNTNRTTPMQSLMQQLRNASKRTTDSSVSGLLMQAADEIERLQRAAYRSSASRPINFKAVRAIRRRHDAVDFDTLEGQARQAHADRDHLLAIISFTSGAAQELLVNSDEPMTTDIPLDVLDGERVQKSAAAP